MIVYDCMKQILFKINSAVLLAIFSMGMISLPYHVAQAQSDREASVATEQAITEEETNWLVSLIQSIMNKIKSMTQNNDNEQGQIEELKNKLVEGNWLADENNPFGYLRFTADSVKMFVSGAKENQGMEGEWELYSPTEAEDQSLVNTQIDGAMAYIKTDLVLGDFAVTAISENSITLQPVSANVSLTNGENGQEFVQLSDEDLEAKQAAMQSDSNSSENGQSEMVSDAMGMSKDEVEEFLVGTWQRADNNLIQREYKSDGTMVILNGGQEVRSGEWEYYEDIDELSGNYSVPIEMEHVGVIVEKGEIMDTRELVTRFNGVDKIEILDPLQTRDPSEADLYTRAKQ